MILNTSLFYLLQLVEAFQCLIWLFFLGIPIGITSSAIGLKICAITAGII